MASHGQSPEGELPLVSPRGLANLFSASCKAAEDAIAAFSSSPPGFRERRTCKNRFPNSFVTWENAVGKLGSHFARLRENLGSDDPAVTAERTRVGFTGKNSVHRCGERLLDSQVHHFHASASPIAMLPPCECFSDISHPSHNGCFWLQDCLKFFYGRSNFYQSPATSWQLYVWRAVLSSCIRPLSSPKSPLSPLRSVLISAKGPRRCVFWLLTRLQSFVRWGHEARETPRDWQPFIHLLLARFCQGTIRPVSHFFLETWWVGGTIPPNGRCGFAITQFLQSLGCVAVGSRSDHKLFLRLWGQPLVVVAHVVSPHFQRRGQVLNCNGVYLPYQRTLNGCSGQVRSH